MYRTAKKYILESTLNQRIVWKCFLCFVYLIEFESELAPHITHIFEHRIEIGGSCTKPKRKPIAACRPSDWFDDYAVCRFISKLGAAHCILEKLSP